MKIFIQKIGNALSDMIMPNIGAFIAWGFITALFIPSGWLPNEKLVVLSAPMVKFLLPLLIGYTAGKNISGVRGGVVGATATMGVIVGADIPMFLGAMIMGPIGGFCTKWFDKKIDSKIPAGFEMLVNNFSAGFMGIILSLIAFIVIGPICVWITAVLTSCIQFFVAHNLLPFVSFFIEPAKALFLNGIIAHGIITPLGTLQTMATGKSMFFLIESNPGNGLGLLLAYCIAGKGTAKASAPGAVIIQFLGGIHEIYFPYVLMNPILIIAMIAGSFVNITLLQLLHGGLVAAAMPGSIFTVILLSAKGALIANLVSLTASTVTSFSIASLLLKFFGNKEVLP